MHSELCLSAPHTMGSLNAEKFEEDKAVMLLSHTLSLPRQRGQAEIRSGVLCNLSFSSFMKTQPLLDL